jgi:alpha-beta hydrolase superfamily lysophospholipase
MRVEELSMQRPVMNPSFVQEDDGSSPKVRWKFPWHLLLKPFKVAIAVMLADPFARLRRKGLKIDEGTAFSRATRALLYRLAFIPLILALFAVAMVYASTHPQTTPSQMDPMSVGLYYDPVSFSSTDDVRVDGWLVPAIDARRVLEEKEKALRKTHPAVILVHDFGGRSQEMLPLVRPLHDAGFVVLLINLRGCGTSSDAGETFGLNEMDDVKAAIEMLCKRPFVDKNRIAVCGVGTGATAALLASENDPRVRALVLSQPMLDSETVTQRLIPHRYWLRWIRPLCEWSFEVAYQVDLDDLNFDKHQAKLNAPSTLLFAKEPGYATLARRTRLQQVRDFLADRLKTSPTVASAN